MGLGSNTTQGQVKIAAADIVDSFLRLSWIALLKILWTRSRQEQLSLTASSLTFTSLIALVPFFTIVLAVLSAFPSSTGLTILVKKWLVSSLVPANISLTVMDYIYRFSAKAMKLGTVGFAAFGITVWAMVFTLESTFNKIWHVKKKRSYGQKAILYWLVLTLEPICLVISSIITAQTFIISKQWFTALSWEKAIFLFVFDVLLLAIFLCLAFKLLPNTHVKWSHAIVGAVFSAFFMAVIKKLLVVYLSYVPVYSKIYGAFSVIPILLIWVYLAWFVVLWGGVICASLPEMMYGKGSVVFRKNRGWKFTLALEVLRLLQTTQNSNHKGLTQPELNCQLGTQSRDLDLVVDGLIRIDWVGRLEEIQSPHHIYAPAQRLILLMPLTQAPLILLARQFLISDERLLKLLLSTKKDHPQENLYASDIIAN